ncbi:MAG: 50S ribosomal protein L9 [Gammaproteobacteria bacterium]|nr:50S ribosomal protein L9 [Gammaproteobacteria bacterium]
MEVILLDRVENLGKLGDKVNVRSGYGRNFLIPQGKAVRVTPESLAEFEARRADLEKQAADEVTRAEGRKRTLEGERFEIKARAGAEGKLYGSIGTTDIADAITAAGQEVERREVRLPETGAFRELGEFEVTLHLHTDVDASVMIAVVAEE